MIALVLRLTSGAVVLALPALARAQAADSTATPRERLEAYAEACARSPQPTDTVAADLMPRRELLAMEEADQADRANLVLQHAPDGMLQALLLPDLLRAYERGEVDGEAVALLTDRVRLKAGLLQRYGTQLLQEGDRFTVQQPIGDPEGLAERRAALCLLPLDLYLMMSEEFYGLQDHGLLD